ncbi:DUF4153 domain-containing protein [Nostoc sp. NIES-2111]
MKWPKLDLADVARGTVQTVRRYPLAVLAAVAACTFALLGINDDWWRDAKPGQFSPADFQREQQFFRLMMAAATGIPVFTGAHLLVGQVRQTGRPMFWGWSVLGLALLAEALLLFHVYSKPEEEGWFLLEMFFYHVAAQGWSAGAAYLVSGRESDFWQLNQGFFLRFFTSTLYAATLWAGLAGAFGVVDTLFSVHIDGKLYASLFAVLALVFHPIFFLAGIPTAWALYQPPVIPYPKPLKAFAQFVLLPLVVIYLLILYAYMGRILVLQTWPQGLVSWLVFGFAIAGILAFLLLWPLRTEGTTGWVQRYTQLFYGALVPLIVLEALAIYKRVHAYGLTPERVILIVLALWLAGITLTGLLTRGHRIRYIPLSLAVVLVLPFVGPWGAVPLSIASQKRRMMAWFEVHGMLKDGRLKPYSGKKALTEEEIRDLDSQLRFLNDADVLRPTLAVIWPEIPPPRVETDSDTSPSPQKRPVLLEPDPTNTTLPIEPSEVFKNLNLHNSVAVDRVYYHSPWDQTRVLDTRGARQVIALGYIGNEGADTVNMGPFHLRLMQQGAILLAKGPDTLRISLKSQMDRIARKDDLPDSLQTIPFVLSGSEGYLYLNQLDFNKAEPYEIGANLLLLVR